MKETVLRWILILCLVSVMLCTGCGTIITLSDFDQEGTKYGMVYSGIRFDCRGAFNPYYMQHIPIGKPLCVIDMPLSLVADSVVLPYTGIQTLCGRKSNKRNRTADEISDDMIRESEEQKRQIKQYRK